MPTATASPASPDPLLTSESGEIVAGESARESARRQREKAERLVRSAELWERGAEGEQRTADVLGTLPIEWTTFHDLRWPGRQFANVDHVAVGPPGVFIIDSKNWSGKVTVKDESLRQNGRRRDQQISGVKEAAMAVGRLLPHPELAVPVLCFVGERDLSARAQGAYVVSTETLSDFLRSQPLVLSPAELTRIRLALEANLMPARGPQRVSSMSVPPKSKGSESGRPNRASRRPKSRSRRRSSSILPSVAVLAALLAFLYVPGVRAAVIDPLSGLIVDPTSTTHPPKQEHNNHPRRAHDKHRKSHP